MEIERHSCKEKFSKFLSEWRGNSIKEVVYNSDDQIDERFLPFQEFPFNNIAAKDLRGFLLEWTRQILHNINCPSIYSDAVARLVIDTYYKVEPEKDVEDSKPLLTALVTQIDSILQEMSSDNWSFNENIESFSVLAIKNGRRTMEDVHVTITDLNTLLGLDSYPPTSYYAVFDGHAGNKAAIYSATHLHHKIANIPCFKTDVKEAIRQGIKETDAGFASYSQHREQGCRSGCTAVCCVIQPHKLYLGWVGDSQAIVFGGGQPIAVTVPHKPDREDEKARIESVGGCVVLMGTWRVNGTLAVSRAIGDVENKPYVTAEPDVLEIDLKNNEDFVLLACDGMWDVLNYEDIASISYEYFGTYAKESDGPGLAASLVTEAKKRGSTDNITVIVVYLQDYARLHETYLRSKISETTVNESILTTECENLGQKDTANMIENQFNQAESLGFHMQSVSQTYTESSFTHAWSTATSEEPYLTIKESNNFNNFDISSNVREFDTFNNEVVGTLKQSTIIDNSGEADFTQFDSNSFYNQKVDIENPLPSVFDVGDSSHEIFSDEVKMSLGGAAEETEKLDAVDFVNWNSEKNVLSEQDNFDSYDNKEELLTTSSRPYFESTLSPDAEPFVSRYGNNTPGLIGDFQQEPTAFAAETTKTDDMSLTDFLSGNANEFVSSSLNPFSTEAAFEPSKIEEHCEEFDKKEFVTNKFTNEEEDRYEHISDLTQSADVKAEDNAYQNYAFEHTNETNVQTTMDVIDDHLHTPVENVKFDADIIPEVKLTYIENINPDLSEVATFSNEEIGYSFEPPTQAELVEINKTSEEAGNSLAKEEFIHENKVVDSLKDVNDIVNRDNDQIISQAEIGIDDDILHFKHSESHFESTEMQNTAAGVIEEPLFSLASKEASNKIETPEIGLFPSSIEQQPTSFEINEISLTKSDVDFPQLASPLSAEAAPFENLNEKQQSYLAVSAVDVEDDESEDGEGWKFYPTESNSVVKTENVDVDKITSSENGVQSNLAKDSSIETGISVNVDAISSELASVTISQATTETKSTEPTTEQSKPKVDKNKAAPKLKASTAKSTTSATTKSSSSSATTKSSTSSVTTKSSTSSKIANKPNVPATTKEVKSQSSNVKLSHKTVGSTTASKPKAPEASKPKLPLTNKAASAVGVKKPPATATVTSKSAPPITKRTVNGTSTTTTSSVVSKESDKSLKLPSKAPESTVTKTTLKKSTTVKTTVSLTKDPTAPNSRPVTASKTSSSTLGSLAKADPKLAKEAVNKNISGVRSTTRSATVTTTKSSVTNGKATSVTTTKTTTKLENSNGVKQPALASKAKAPLTKPLTTFKSPVPSTSNRLSPSKMTPPAAKSSPIKATTPTTPKTKILTSTPRTPTSATKNRLTTPSSKSSPASAKKTKSSHVEKGTIDAQSKETNQSGLPKNGNGDLNGDGKPKIEQELQNGFEKLENGDNSVDYHHNSANGSVIDNETLLQASGDMFLA